MDNDYLYSYRTIVKTNYSHGNLETDSSYSCVFFYESGKKKPLHDFYIKVFKSLDIKNRTRYLEIDSRKVNFEDVNDKFAQNFMKKYLSKKYPEDYYVISTKPVELDKYSSQIYASFIRSEKQNREMLKPEIIKTAKTKEQSLER